MLNKYEYEIQLKNYSLNNLTLKKYSEKFLRNKSPYTINSDDIRFKIYPMQINWNEITVLSKFTIANEDFKLSIEYIAKYLTAFEYNNFDDKIYNKIEPAAFVTMYKYARELSVNIISDVVSNKVIFPLYDLRKIKR